MPALLVTSPQKAPFRVELAAEAVTVGRSSANRVPVKDDPKVSREHCRIARQGDRWVVEDLGTTNGTHLNGGRIDRAQELFDGDEIRVGATSLVYEDPAHRRESLARKVFDSVARAIGAKRDPASEGELLAKGRLRCQCGAVLNVAGKSPGEKVGCPRCRTVNTVPGGGGGAGAEGGA